MKTEITVKTQKERLEKLNFIARKQLQLLLDEKNIVGIGEYEKLSLIY